MFCLKFTCFSFCFLFVIIHHTSFSSVQSFESRPPLRLINSFTITFSHHISISFFLTRQNTRFLSTKCLLVSLLLLLSGDIQLNPGPLSFNVCTYNVRSLFNPTHSSCISTIASQHKVHLFCLTETWHNDHHTAAEIIELLLLISLSSAFLAPYRLMSNLSLMSLVVALLFFSIIPALLFLPLLITTNHLKCHLSPLPFLIYLN